jgi:hypothetical protein
MAAKGAKINAKPDVAAFRAAVQAGLCQGAREIRRRRGCRCLKDAENVRKAVK